MATLDAEDTLLHLCINGGLDGAAALIRIVDIDVVARSGRVDWTQFADRARARHVRERSVRRCSSDPRPS